MKQGLIKLANHLDNLGHRDLADRLDNILKKNAEDLETNVDLGSSELEQDVSSAEILAAEEEAEEGEDSEELMDSELMGDILGSNVGEVYLDSPIESGLSYETEAETEALADDFVFASNSTQDRIDKLAALMSSEFSNGNLSSFSR